MYVRDSPKRGPIEAQDGPRGRPDSPRGAQEEFKRSPGRPKRRPEEPKIAPRKFAESTRQLKIAQESTKEILEMKSIPEGLHHTKVEEEEVR